MTSAYTAEGATTRKTASNSKGIVMRRLSWPGEGSIPSEAVVEVDTSRQREGNGEPSRLVPAYQGTNWRPA